MSIIRSSVVVRHYRIELGSTLNRRLGVVVPEIRCVVLVLKHRLALLLLVVV